MSSKRMYILGHPHLGIKYMYVNLPIQIEDGDCAAPTELLIPRTKNQVDQNPQKIEWDFEVEKLCIDAKFCSPWSSLFSCMCLPFFQNW